MSLSPNEKYPGATADDPNYKAGKFKDNNPPTINNGSPLKAIDRNERLALEEAIMTDAGFEYNGTLDTPQDSQMFKAYKAALSNGANLLSNHNFIIPSPDDSQPAPDGTARSYPPGFQIFSGVFANETTGITNLTYSNGLVSFTAGDFYIPVANAGGVERITEFVASVADFDGKPRQLDPSSWSLIGNEYRVTVGVSDLAGGPLGSVKFEQGSTATRHEVIDYSSQSLKYRVGYRVEIHSDTIPPWLLKADGSTVLRGVDDLLWIHASNSGLLISQALKDADPEQYAMYYGDGDGSTTFSLPNWYLGHFARGNPAGVALGETQGDAIRNITGSIGHISESFDKSGSASGVFQKGGGNPNQFTPISTDTSTTGYVTFDASTVVPTSTENRPKSGHINICIERGKIPV